MTCTLTCAHHLQGQIAGWQPHSHAHHRMMICAYAMAHQRQHACRVGRLQEEEAKRQAQEEEARQAEQRLLELQRKAQEKQAKERREQSTKKERSPRAEAKQRAREADLQAMRQRLGMVVDASTNISSIRDGHLAPSEREREMNTSDGATSGSCGKPWP